MFSSRVKSSEIQNIHERTLWVLENVGVIFESPDAIALFSRHGAKVDGTKVYMSEALIKQALSSVVRSFTVHGLSSSVEIGGGRPVLTGPSSAITILKKGERATEPTGADFVDTLRLNDSSRVMSMVNSQHIYARDIPIHESPSIKTALALQNSGKPVITYCSTYQESALSLAVAKEFYGNPGHYYALGVGNMISPLKYSRESVGAIDAYVEFAQPIVLACCASMGMTSPVTIGGTLVQTNAEVLAGIIYAQLKRPGLPVVYGNVSASLDMRFATSAIGSYEAIALIPYIKALGEFYKMPVRCGGALSDSKEVDFQAGAESAVAAATTIANGIDFAMHMAGEVNSYNTYSMEKQVLDEEIIERCVFLGEMDFFSGGDTDIETIENVGPGGQFLMEEQTLEKYKESSYIPKLSNRETYSSWEASGGKPIEQAASEEVARRLASHQKPALSPSQRAFTDKICGAFGKKDNS
ncbi:trimethylamine methyltransferase [Synergistales bacterium]|nr:trimethylamine methyltransferase [Synergistales bacterium]